MQKDFKIGMAFGLVIVLAAAIWLSTRQSLTTKARMEFSQNTAIPQQIPATQSVSAKEASSDIISPKKSVKTQTEPKHGSEQSVQPQAGKFHIVSKGETLSNISYKFYGSAAKWQKILAANPHIMDANKLQPGTKVIIPQ